MTERRPGTASGPGAVPSVGVSAAEMTTWTTVPLTQRPSGLRSHSYELSPGTESGIKATWTSTSRAKGFIYLNLLRWASLSICTVMFIGEVFVAAFSLPFFDTYFAIPWALVVAGWDVWRLVRMHKPRGRVLVSVSHLVVDGLILLISLVSCVGVGWAFNTGGWYREESRATVLLAGIAIMTIVHIVIFIRSCIEKRHGLPVGGTDELELPMHSTTQQQQPAQIIVRYVQTCPKCGSHSEPKPGEAINESMAACGELQPQGISPTDLQHVH
ncbi:hypothetical protein JX266_002556 [Neoarthrinium moseri]|nr:hypothetical protein JX266_002556 [Neoarthrinium moseri]